MIISENISFGYNNPIKNIIQERGIPCAYTDKPFSKRAGRASLEHIHPHSKDGFDGLKNYLVVNAKINTERGNIPFSQWLTERPEIITNIQKYLDRARGLIVEGQDYVNEIVPVLNREAQGVAMFHGKHNKLNTNA